MKINTSWGCDDGITEKPRDLMTNINYSDLEAKPIIFYTCHTCAIKVPAAFANEHIASIKHQAHVRIANEAAQRMRGLVSALPPPSTEQLNARFCAHCSTIISGNHDTTKNHRIAVLQDKMLKELMVVYVNDNDDINNAYISDHTDEDLTIKGNNNENIGNTKDTRYIEIFKLQAVEINDQVINIIKNKIVDVQIGNNDNVEKTNRVRYSVDTCNKIRAIMEFRARNPQVKAVTGTTEVNLEYDDFVPQSNKFVKVASDHYHRFVGEGGKMKCVVCNAKFLCGEPLSQIFSLRHLVPKNISLSDEQDVSKINDKYSLCYICNQQIKNDKIHDHIGTLHHQTNKVKRVSLSTLRQTNANEKRVIDTKIETANQNTHGNVKHQATNTEEEEVKNIDKYQRLMKDMFQNNTPENKANNAAGSSEVKHKFFNEVFENTSEDKVENIAGSSKKLNESYIRLDETFKNNAPEGQANNSHKNRGVKKFMLGNSSRTLGYPLEMTDDENVVHCVICDCKVPNVLEIKKCHLTGKNHITNDKSASIDKVTYPYEISKQGHIVLCTICNCHVPNNPKNKKEHLLGPRHAVNVEKKRLKRNLAEGRGIEPGTSGLPGNVSATPLP